MPVWQGSTLHQIRAARHIAATGTLEQPLVFPDNDLPGVMLAGGARRLAALYAVKPGEAAVVATTNDRGLDAALALHAAGVRIAAVADLRPDAGGGELAARVEAAGIELLRGHDRRPRASAASPSPARCVAPVDASGYALEGHARTFACDLIAVSGGVAPGTSLLLQGGAKARYDEATGRFVADGLHDIVHAAGSVAGHDDADSAELSGRIAGAEAALALQRRQRQAARPSSSRTAPRCATGPRPRRWPRRPPSRASAATAARRSSTSTRTSRRRTSRSPPPRATTRSSSPSATRR